MRFHTCTKSYYLACQTHFSYNSCIRPQIARVARMMVCTCCEPTIRRVRIFSTFISSTVAEAENAQKRKHDHRFPATKSVDTHHRSQPHVLKEQRGRPVFKMPKDRRKITKNIERKRKTSENIQDMGRGRYDNNNTQV